MVPGGCCCSSGGTLAARGACPAAPWSSARPSKPQRFARPSRRPAFRVRPDALLGVYTGDAHTYANGDVVQSVVVVLTATPVEGRLTEDGIETVGLALVHARRSPQPDLRPSSGDARRPSERQASDLDLRWERLAGGATAVEWCDSVGLEHRPSSNGQEGVLTNVIDPDERITCCRTRWDGHPGREIALPIGVDRCQRRLRSALDGPDLDRPIARRDDGLALGVVGVLARPRCR